MHVSQPIQLVRLVVVTLFAEVPEELVRLKPKLSWVFFLRVRDYPIFCDLVVITLFTAVLVVITHFIAV